MTTNGPAPGQTGPGTASSLRMALRVVNAVLDREASGRAGFNVSRLATEVGIERSKASRTVQDLCDKGFLERLDDSTLRVGDAYFATAASLHPGLPRRSRPLLRRMA
ncbi:transcriptional regulator, partial [Streptomyces sp. NPDC002491]